MTPTADQPRRTPPAASHEKACRPLPKLIPRPAMVRTLLIRQTAMTAPNFPSTMSRREAGETSSVSKVPRSFSPATWSKAAYTVPVKAEMMSR